MELGYIPAQELDVFHSLLLPEVADAIGRGEPLTALALTEDEVAVGAAAGYLEEHYFLLRSLYVAPEYRRRGGGRMLVEKLAELIRPYTDTLRAPFTVTKEEHETLAPFFTALGFEEEADDGRNIYFAPLGKTAESSFFSAPAKPFGTRLSELSEGALSLLEKAAFASEAPLPDDGLRSADREVSAASFNGSEPQALVLFERSQSGALSLSAAWSVSRDPAVLPALLRSAMAYARAKYPPETPLLAQAVNPASAALVRALMPDAVPISRAYSLTLLADDTENS